MKLKLLLAVVAMSFVASCSSDDSAAPVNPETPTPKHLKEIRTVVYQDGTETSDNVMEFDNDQLITHKFYANGQLLGTRNYTYHNGLLENYKQINNNISNDVVEERSYLYDDQQRMIKFTYRGPASNWQVNIKTFNYNDDNTITFTQNNPMTVGLVGTYYLNDAGFVYKMRSPTINDDAIYMNNNLITHESDVYGVKNYAYDMQHPVKGEYVNRYSNSFGSYKANVVLARGFEAAEDISENYILFDPEFSEIFEYDFDIEGYPIKRRSIINGVVFSESEIIYE